MEQAKIDGTTRRRFLGTAAGATGVALAAAVWPSTAEAATAATGPTTAAAAGRPFTSGKFALDLGGTSAGLLKGVDGGSAYADVVSEKIGLSFYSKKHLAGVKYEDLTIQTTFDPPAPIRAWIDATLSFNHVRKDGRIQVADYDGKVTNFRAFYNALVTEIGFPACDATSKDPAYLSLSFAPEYTTDSKGSGQLPSATPQKAWLPRNFRLTIDGLDCTKVTKVEALTIKQKFIEDQIGDVRDYQKEPASLEFPDLVVTFAVQSVATWQAWFNDFVIAGNDGDDKEKSGALTFLSSDLKSELLTLEFDGLGIFRLDNDVEQPTEPVNKMSAELYVERMRLKPAKGTTNSG